MSKSILIITPRVPYPLKDGGSLAMYQCIEMYHQMRYEVHVASINTHKHWLGEQDYPALFNQIESFQTVTVNTKVRMSSAFLNLFSKKSYNVERFVNKDFKNLLVKILRAEDFDLIQFESIYTAPYLETIAEHSTARTLCRVHNIEHNIWNQLAEQERGIFKRKYIKLLSERLKKYELATLSQFDCLLTISKVEGIELKKLDIQTPQHHLPYGIERIRFQQQQITQEKQSVYHLGSMDWLPNQEGVSWFVKRVWPLVIKKQPKLTFYLAGRNMPKGFFRYKSKTINVVGEVEDMTTFSLEKNIMVLPLLSGAGLRIKVIEAMMLGKTIISTTCGIQGVPLEHKREILLADSPGDFADLIDWCLSHPEEAKRIGLNAQEYALTHFDKRTIYKELDLYLSQVTQNG
jgi:glycosyltransferase involved in cell wall biosynthesis